MSDSGWIGVDLDGTLAEYHGWNEIIGPPVPRMVERVKGWLDAGVEVRIMTARVSPCGGFSRESMMLPDETFVAQQRSLIRAWCMEHLGRILPVTHEKDWRMSQLWDDRAIQVIPNTGLRADGVDL